MVWPWRHSVEGAGWRALQPPALLQEYSLHGSVCFVVAVSVWETIQSSLLPAALARTQVMFGFGKHPLHCKFLVQKNVKRLFCDFRYYYDLVW